MCSIIFPFLTHHTAIWFCLRVKVLEHLPAKTRSFFFLCFLALRVVCFQEAVVCYNALHTVTVDCLWRQSIWLLLTFFSFRQAAMFYVNVKSHGRRGAVPASFVGGSCRCGAYCYWTTSKARSCWRPGCCRRVMPFSGVINNPGRCLILSGSGGVVGWGGSGGWL